MAYLDAFFNENTLSQTLTTVAGEAYVISYWVADNDPNLLKVTFGGSTLFDGTAPTGGIDFGDYVNYSFGSIAATTNTVLAFSGQFTSGGFGTLLDDVSVTAATATPEPATLRLGFVALLALGVLSRRRASTSRQ